MMSVFCEKLEPNELSRGITYLEDPKFVRLRNTEIPENIPIEEKWWTDPYCFPGKMGDSPEKIVNFQVRPDDVWVVTFPKCGTTWTQEMVWQICNDLQLDTPLHIPKRFPFLEFGFFWRNWTRENMDSVNEMPSPRFIKSHLPAPLLPKEIWTVKPKIIYVARNAKDVITSYYHHYRNVIAFSGTLTDFVHLFMDNRVNYTPYASHILNFWNLRNEENILIITYEDMKKDLPSVIKHVAGFLGKSYTDEQILKLSDHLSFEKFSKNPCVNFEGELSFMRTVRNLPVRDKDFHFIRKGQLNSFKDDMSPEMIEIINVWLEKSFEDMKNDRELRRIVYYE